MVENSRIERTPFPVRDPLGKQVKLAEAAGDGLLDLIGFAVIRRIIFLLH